MTTVRRQCRTCWRMRPEGEFVMRTGSRRLPDVPICRPCRVRLWNRPDSHEEYR